MLIIGGIVLATVLVVGAVVVFAYRDRATSTTADEVAAALDLVAGGGMPGDYGLYLYETTGFETTDALAGGRHDYPAETFLTIQPGGCGTLVRWQALLERWSEWDHCDDRALAGWASYNEWFGVGNHDVWVCDQPVPTVGEDGSSWTVECTRGNANQTVFHEIVGVETLQVAGEPVDTLHVRTESTTVGNTEGSGTSDIWFLRDTALVVQRISESNSVTDTRIGGVGYHEEYRVLLSSLTPMP